MSRELTGVLIAVDGEGRRYPIRVIDEFWEQQPLGSPPIRGHRRRYFQYQPPNASQTSEIDWISKGVLELVDPYSPVNMRLLSDDPMADSYDSWLPNRRGASHE
jgi:hypothetical protein